MADLALLDLYDAVSARFTSEATPCTLLFGWDESPKHIRGPRIVMVPGDDGATAFNGALPVRQPGRNVRSLGTLAELFHVVVSASDTADPEGDRAQYTACRLLFDAWYRAANLAVGIRMAFITSSWMVERTVRRAGAALIATFTIEAMIPDSALLETDFQARGLFDGFLLDAEQSFQTEPDYPDADAVAVARRLTAARHAFVEVVDFVAGNTKAAPNAVFAGSVPYLMLAGNLMAGWQMGRALLAAREALTAGEDAAFMQAKITTARFYADHILSKAPGIRDSIVEGADSVTALALEAF